MFAIEFEDTQEEAWRAEARCRDGSASLVELFFSEQLDDIARAKQFCQACEVRAECLEAALERREPWGVWGGELLANGKVLAQKRKRGRPPKVAPPTHLDPLIRVQDVLAQKQTA
jgi:WhiB family redox-sensing transcriptional regulator